MQLVLLHYHLRRGGVTSVIANHLRSLDAHLIKSSQRMNVCVLTGNSCGWEHSQQPLRQIDLEVAAINGLDYDDSTQEEANELARRIKESLHSRGYGPDDTVLHVHNHSLGKNLSLPGALAELASNGYRLLLHVHDFAEDFRPQQYCRLLECLGGGDPARLAKALYPQASQIHYAVLNGRDQAVLTAAGIDQARVHFLPNPVADFGELPSKEEARVKLAERFKISPETHFVLYPVRGIRRKNLGELLLWSALAEGQAAFGLTLPPANPAEQPSYRRWKELSAELDLPCYFELGADGGLSFVENLSAADAIITTSVAEGFGMVFLESWLAGRPLIGRELPEITADFLLAGMWFLDSMSPILHIPMDWLGREAIAEKRRLVFDNVLSGFDRSLNVDEPESALAGETIDFAILATHHQERVVRMVTAETGRREALLDVNPWLTDYLNLNSLTARELIENNAAAVRENYSFAISGERLAALYETVIASPAAETLTGPPEGGAILRRFLALDRFHPLRVEA